MHGLTIFNTIVGIGIIGIIAGIALVFALIFLQETHSKLFHWIKKHALTISFLLALGGMIGSLIYSNVFMFAPCEFCWWQRIFLYPQVIILGVAAWYKDLRIGTISIILSVIGICVSIYHVLMQAGVVGSDATCSLTGVSCTKIDVLIFGWITIPIMCLVMFAGIIVLNWVARRK
jgi:disulfide bond formation protein DsbB